MLTQEMNALVHEIAAAQDARLAATARLRKSGRAKRDARNAAMSRLRKTLRADLTRSRRHLAGQEADRRMAALRLRAELGRFRADLARGEATRVASVRTWLGTVSADRAGAHAAWRDMTVSLQGKRVAAATSAKKAAAPEPAAAPKTE